MDVDDALAALDDGGRQQKKLMLLLGVQSIAAAYIIFNMEFVGHTPATFECHRNGTDGPQMLVNACFNDTSANCDRIEFRSPYDSVVTEWLLVCDRAAEAKSLQSLFMLGMTLGSPLVGPLADRFGRRLMGLTMLGTQAVLTVGLAAAPNFATFGFIRLLTGVLQMGGMALTSLGMEMVRPHYRSTNGVIGSAAFSAGMLLLGGTAYFVTSWRLLMLLSGVIGAVTVLVVSITVPPSARWLLQHGNQQRAEEVLLRIARANGVHPPAKLELTMPPGENSHSTDTCCTLFRRPRSALWTVILAFNLAVHTLTYYGLTSAAAGMGRGRFSSFAFSALVELPPLLLVAYLMERVGRRYTLCGGMAMGGVSCLLIWLLPSSFIDNYGGRLVLSLIGKMCITTTFIVTTVFAIEIFPTSVRNTGVGITNICARIAGVAYPFAALLDAASKDSQFLLFGALVMTSALLDLALPETQGKTLANSVEEMVALGVAEYRPLHLDSGDEDSDSEQEDSVVLFSSRQTKR